MFWRVHAPCTKGSLGSLYGLAAGSRRVDCVGSNQDTFHNWSHNPLSFNDTEGISISSPFMGLPFAAGCNQVTLLNRSDLNH